MQSLSSSSSYGFVGNNSSSSRQTSLIVDVDDGLPPDCLDAMILDENVLLYSLYQQAILPFIENGDDDYTHFIERAMCGVLNQGNLNEKQDLIRHLITCSQADDAASAVKNRYSAILRILNVNDINLNEVNLDFELVPENVIDAIDIAVGESALQPFQAFENDRISNSNHIEFNIGATLFFVSSVPEDSVGLVGNPAGDPENKVIHNARWLTTSEVVKGESQNWYKGDPDNPKKLMQLLSNCQNTYLPESIRNNFLSIKEQLNAQKAFVGLNFCGVDLCGLDLQGLDLSHATLDTAFLEDFELFFVVRSNTTLCGTFLFRILKSDYVHLKTLALTRLIRASRDSLLSESARSYFLHIIDYLNARRLLGTIDMSGVSLA